MPENTGTVEPWDTDPVFVDAYSTTTGIKQRVPAHFFDIPELCKGLSKSPSQKAAEQEQNRAPGEPGRNASREHWADYARVIGGATDDDLTDDDGNDLSRDELVELYGTPTDNTNTPPAGDTNKEQ